MRPTKHYARQASGAGKIKSNYSAGILAYLIESIKAIENRVWVFSYSIEEARQRYAGGRQLLRLAVACLILALLRLAGACYA